MIEPVAFAYEYRVLHQDGQPTTWTASVAETDPRAAWRDHDGIDVRAVRPLVEAPEDAPAALDRARECVASVEAGVRDHGVTRFRLARVEAELACLRGAVGGEARAVVGGGGDGE